MPGIAFLPLVSCLCVTLLTSCGCGEGFGATVWLASCGLW